MSVVTLSTTGHRSASLPKPRESLSFACDPSNPSPLDAPKVELLTDSAVRHGSRAKVVSLQGNDLNADNGSAIRALARYLNTNMALRQLDVSMCRLGNLGACQLCFACIPMRTSALVSYLTHINLSMNSLDDEGLLRIGRILAFRPSCIRVVTAKYNPITMMGLGAFLAVNAPLRLLDVSHCLMECAGVEGENGAVLGEVIHGLRKNTKTEAFMADGAQYYIVPGAAGRMMDAVKANDRTQLFASVARIAKGVYECHDEADASKLLKQPPAPVATVRSFVATCLVEEPSTGDEDDGGGADDQTPARRPPAESEDASGVVPAFRSPLKPGTAAMQNTSSVPAPEDAEWYERPAAPVPSPAVMEAIACFDGPIVTAQEVDMDQLKRQHSGCAAKGKRETSPSAVARAYALTDVRPVESELGVHHTTQDDPALHVDAPAEVVRRWAHHPVPAADSTTERVGRQQVRTGNGEAPPGAPTSLRRMSVQPRGGSGNGTRNFKYLYEERVPLIGLKRLSAAADEHADDSRAVAIRPADPPQRTVDGLQDAERRRRRSRSRDGVGAGTSRSSSVAFDPSSARSSANTSRATSPNRTAVNPNATAAERAVVLRKLLGFSAASTEQCAQLLFVGCKIPEGADSVDEVVATTMASNGDARGVLGLPAALPPVLQQADARPDVLAKAKVGSETRVNGLAKHLWCLLHAACEPVTLAVSAPSTLDAMSDIPEHAPWAELAHREKARRGKPPASMVELQSRRAAEEHKARRLVETLQHDTTDRSAVKQSRSRLAAAVNASSRFRSQSAEWVARRRALPTGESPGPRRLDPTAKSGRRHIDPNASRQ